MAENAVIGKVVLDFDFENEAGYNNFCDKLQEEFQEEFLNIFNEVLNKFPINRTIRLDKLSIDVGQIYSNDFNNFFTILKEELDSENIELDSIKRANNLKMQRINKFIKPQNHSTDHEKRVVNNLIAW